MHGFDRSVKFRLPRSLLAAAMRTRQTTYEFATCHLYFFQFHVFMFNTLAFTSHYHDSTGSEGARKSQKTFARQLRLLPFYVNRKRLEGSGAPDILRAKPEIFGRLGPLRHASLCDFRARSASMWLVFQKSRIAVFGCSDFRLILGPLFPSCVTAFTCQKLNITRIRTSYFSFLYP